MEDEELDELERELEHVSVSEDDLAEAWAEVDTPLAGVRSVPTSEASGRESGRVTPVRANSDEGAAPSTTAAAPVPAPPALRPPARPTPAPATAPRAAQPGVVSGPAAPAGAAAPAPRPAIVPRPTGVRPPLAGPRPSTTTGGAATTPAGSTSAAPLPAPGPAPAAALRPAPTVGAPAVRPVAARPPVRPAARAAAGQGPQPATPAPRPAVGGPSRAAAPQATAVPAARPVAAPAAGASATLAGASAVQPTAATPRPAQPAAARPAPRVAPAAPPAAAEPAPGVTAAAAAVTAAAPTTGSAVASAVPAAPVPRQPQPPGTRSLREPTTASQSEILPAEGEAPPCGAAEAVEVATAGAGAGAWGWLRSAVRDVHELGDSFAKVLQEVAAADSDEDEEAARLAALAKAARRAPPPGAEAPLPPDAEAKRAEVLARLQGEERRTDALASEAGRALSSLWGWGTQVARKVEQVAAVAAKEIVGTPLPEGEAGAAAQEGGGGEAGASGPAPAPAGTGRLGQQLGATLGTLGRMGQQMLERGLQAGSSLAATASGGGRGTVSAETVLLGEPGPKGDDEDLDFNSCFYIFGGRQELEGLERMGSELANRVRSKLPEGAREQLDRTLAQLQPVFDMAAEHPADAKAEGEGGAPGEPLAAGHAVIEDVAAAGCEFADELVSAAAQHVERLLAAPPHPEALAADAGGGAAVALAEGEATPASRPAAAPALRRLRGEGTRRVAEVASLCMERLVALARSVSSWRQTGRPTTDGVVWPPSAEATGLLLRRQAHRMVGDMQAMGEAFDVAVESVAALLDKQARSDEFGKLGAEARAVLGADVDAATAKVHEAGRALLNVCWLSVVDQEWLEA